MLSICFLYQRYGRYIDHNIYVIIKFLIKLFETHNELSFSTKNAIEMIDGVQNLNHTKIILDQFKEAIIYYARKRGFR